MNRNIELIRQRDEDIYALYKRLRDSGGYATSEQVIRTIASMPAPRFYMDERTLAKRIAPLRKGEVLPGRGMRCYYYLYWQWLGEDDRRKVGMETVCGRLVRRPAPSFYLGPDMVKKIILKERRREKEALYEKANR